LAAKEPIDNNSTMAKVMQVRYVARKTTPRLDSKVL
jgi:hypothetical protein